MNSICFRGAVKEVTGSKIEISSYKDTILLDYGLVQGHRDVAYLKNKEFKENPLNPTAVVLTHSHLDHSGLLPTLQNNQPIYCTKQTAELCKYMLPDALKVMIKDTDVIKRMFKRKKRKVLVEPLYTEEQIKSVLDNFVTIDYRQDTKITDEISIRLYDSCHILGSASVRVDVNRKGIHKKVFYTSDLGHDYSLISNEPDIQQDITHLIIETTYGNKVRKKENPAHKLLDCIIETYKQNGRIIIPAFSVARMQSIILLLHKLYRENALPDIPVYVDSPLGNKVTNIYRKNLDLLNKETISFFQSQGFDPFEFPRLEYINDINRTEQISKSKEPAIIISASGMAEGGMVRTFLKDNIGYRKNSVCFVGYCAEGTLGRRFLESPGLVSIDGKEYRVRCSVDYIEGFSAHADIDYLIEYIRKTVHNNKLEAIYLIHGENDAAERVKKVLASIGIENVIIPELNKEYKL